MNAEKKVWVVGHKNPDTDSICSAIAYADIKNRTENRSYKKTDKVDNRKVWNKIPNS